MQITVHDINMPGDGLYYSVSLPLNTAQYRKLCENPNVVRVRSVLSWNTPPSTTDPNKLEYYGNRVDAHVQIRPGQAAIPGQPLYTIIGGIDVAHVNDASGLTQPFGGTDPFFAFNGLHVPVGAPFGGTIVINGPLGTGKYRMRITNLNDGTWRYATEPFTCVGFLPFAPYVQYTTVTPDANTGFMDFLPYEKNILSILTRFVPGGDARVRVDMELQVAPGVYFSKTIQMDNTAPSITLDVNDDGKCDKFKKGQTIPVDFSYFDAHLLSWSFGSTWGGGMSGGDTPLGAFHHVDIVTPANPSTPCGGISLDVWDKTIIDSQGVGRHSSAYHPICLQS
jgi:hypothetical protein